ncbi:myosin-11 isoform X2 [Bombyx mori]|uniref:Uncharacterized protein n=1 Tax=Bombyx mori TaxID=7091 RepID=A0A8R2C8U2_BOMMO|nr:myosin-11 [Bombyx mori]
MDGQGMSLFQGAMSIHINNSAQDRLEEQEEIEDQKRRHKELQQELANGFDDLSDEDEASSVNSSGNFTLDPHNHDVPQTCTGLPPVYGDSLKHLKEAHNLGETPKKYCESSKNHRSHTVKNQEDQIHKQFSPFGGGDLQINYCQQDLRGHLNGMNNFDEQEYQKYKELKVIYEMRVKECQELAMEIKKSDAEIDSLRARLSAAINDKDKAELSLQEAQHLHASSKHNIIELEQQITTLTKKLMESDQAKEQLKLELRSANMSLQELQQRCHNLQVTHTHDTDTLFREQQERHREEVDRLQNDLTKAKHRLEEKENEIKILEKRCMENVREKEEMLIEKGSTINRLASELEVAQSRLLNGDTARLKEKVLQLTTERNTAKEQIKELGSKLQLTAQELVICRNNLNANQKEYENWRSTLHQILVESLPENTYLGEPPSPGKLATLKEILSRYKMQMQKLSSMQDEIVKRDKKIDQNRKLESELRAKLDEQKGIEMQLNSRLAVLQNKIELLGSNSDSELLEGYKNENERLQGELEEARAEIKNAGLKYAELEMEYDKLRSEKGSRATIVQEANADLLRELEKYSSQLKDTLRENGELKTLYLQVCSKRDSITRELKEQQSMMQKEREYFRAQERDSRELAARQGQTIEKLNAEFHATKAELEGANRRISELQREFTDKQKEFSEKLNKYLEDEKTAMRKEMEPCSHCEKHLKRIRLLDEQLSKCTIQLASHESNVALMKELKSKGEFFLQYITDRFNKLQEQRSVGTNTDGPAPPPADPAPLDPRLHDDDTLAAKTALMMKEKAIREQIAEKFTLEMKTVEMNCARRIKEIENEQLETIAKLKDLLERKAQEVEKLKEFILTERTKVTQILEAKENEISVLIKEHNELQNECQDVKDALVECKRKSDRYKEKLSKLGSLEDVLKSDRENIKQRSCTDECQAMRTKLTELQLKLTHIEHKYEALHSEHSAVQEKYKNAKKTILTYKDYVQKKDMHITNEMNRIQEEYRKIFFKLQNQINCQIKCRIQEEKNTEMQQDSQQSIESDYSDRINNINQEISRLAHFHMDDEATTSSK